jgi:hypothetical protein
LVCKVGVVLQIVEEVLQGISIGRSNHNHKKMLKGGPNELGHIFGESVFEKLRRGPGERKIVSLFPASYFDCTGRMERTELLPMYENNKSR